VARVHVRHVADEFFYVIRGSGLALIGGQEAAIEPGDVIFVPKGSDHRLRGPAAGAGEPLEVVFLVDRPGLASEFREGQAEYERMKRALTLAELNRISEKYGTTYRTVQ
jgi:oxalate decarboxylase/phosphoglucose isomerase-like protein (cupin superfamily)